MGGVKVALLVRAATELEGGRVRALDSVEGRECRFGAVQRLESPVGHALTGSRAARTAVQAGARRALGAYSQRANGYFFASLRGLGIGR